MLIKIFMILCISLAECGRIVLHPKSINWKKSSIKAGKSLRSRGEVMENMFIFYDPSFLAVVWPKISNGVHLTIGHFCFEDLSIFLRDLSDGRAWAYKTADASGRYESSLFAGNRFWLGSKDLCLKLDSESSYKEGNNDTWGEFYSADYLHSLLTKEKRLEGSIEEWRSLVERDELMQRVVRAENEPPFRLAYYSLRAMLNLTRLSIAQSYDITIGVCLPRSCASEDIASLINFSIMLNDNLKSNKSLGRAAKITSLRHVESYYDIKSDTGAVMLIFISIILISLALIATAVDIDLIKFRAYSSKSLSFDLQKYNTSDNRFVASKTTEIESKIVDVETLTINNFNNSNNINMVTVKKVVKPNAAPPSITLDVVSSGIGSCQRCGKYKKQCMNPKQDNTTPCPRVKYNSCASLTTEYKMTNGFFKSVLLSFSLKHSWMRLVNTTMANKELSVVHVSRIAATMWVMFVHVAVIAHYLSEDGGDINEHNNMYYILATGTLAFDTLFFVSGVLSSHHQFYLKSRYSVRELVSCGGSCGSALQLLCFVSNRVVRLIPPYMFAVLLSGVLGRVWRDTAALITPDLDYTNCHTYWWRNLLYITNFYPQEQQCMQVSWYLSVDTQLHALCAALCSLAFVSRRRTALALVLACALAATALDLLTSLSQHAPRFSDSFGAYWSIIARPWSHVAAYFVGVLVGWLVHTLQGELNVSKVTWYGSWVFSALACGVGWAAACAAWAGAPHAWVLALAWPVCVCATTYADVSKKIVESRIVAALSRLSYGTLVLHGAIARALLLASDTALCSHPTCLWWYWCGTAAGSTAAALLLALLLELPACCLLRRLADALHS